MNILLSINQSEFSSSRHVILTNAPLLVSELINKQKSGRVEMICIGIRLIWGSKQLSVRRWFHFSLGDKGAINYRNHSEFIPSPCLHSPSRYWLEAKWRHSIMGNWVWLTYAVRESRAPQGWLVYNSDTTVADVTNTHVRGLWPAVHWSNTHRAPPSSCSAKLSRDVSVHFTELKEYAGSIIEDVNRISHQVYRHCDWTEHKLEALQPSQSSKPSPNITIPLPGTTSKI